MYACLHCFFLLKFRVLGGNKSKHHIDMITECYNTTGDYALLIKVYARAMKDYQDFMLNTLGNTDCIGSLHSIIVIGEIKDSHCIPVAR